MGREFSWIIGVGRKGLERRDGVFMDVKIGGGVDIPVLETRLGLANMRRGADIVNGDVVR